MNSKQRRKRSAKKMKPLAMPLSLVLALFLMFGGTMAWFVASDGMVNPFHTKSFRYEVKGVDIFTPPDDADPAGPGDTYNKVVGATNTGDVPAFVRIMVLPYMIAQDGVTLLATELGKEVHLLDLNTTDWADGGDGYYYYLHQLAPNTSTTDLHTDLFTKVMIESNLGTEYDGAELKISVKMESSNIHRWSYREGWWGTDAAITSGDRALIDSTLADLTNS